MEEAGGGRRLLRCGDSEQSRAGSGGVRQDMILGQMKSELDVSTRVPGAAAGCVRGSGMRCAVFAALEAPADGIQKMIRSR